MNKSKQKTNGSFETLNSENPLWNQLEKNPPQWWKDILKDKELYVEIRKDNYANVYYYGGNVARVRWKDENISAETHQKYLGKSDKTNPYPDCTAKLNTVDGLKEIKENICQEYHKLLIRKTTDERNGVYTSNEKWIQGVLKLRFPECYIDSEFAYRTAENQLIRFDLVELRRGDLFFIELKLITDSRLRSKNESPEIIGQMQKYAEFIEAHEKELIKYYTKVLKIKKQIDLWNANIQITGLSKKPELLIVNTYKKEKITKGKQERIKAIENLKNETQFDTVITDYLNLCK